LTGLPQLSFGVNSFNATPVYYQNAEWVPTYISKQYSGIVCISDVQLSLNEIGNVKLKASMFLMPPAGLDMNYVVHVVGNNADSVTCKDIGQKLKVLVTETASGNSCWSFVLIEDKLKPTVNVQRHYSFVFWNIIGFG
jgi:hypothetical protein